MSNLIKAENTVEVIKLPTATGLAMYAIPEDTPKENKAILYAANGRKIKDASEAELEEKVLLHIAEGLVLLGHKNHLSNAQDQAVLARAVANVIWMKYDFRTFEEMQLIFNMGFRGDLKEKPDEVTYLNLEQITNWFKRYHRKVKPEAISQLKEVPQVKQIGTGETISFSEWKERNPEAAASWDENIKKIAERSRSDKAKEAERKSETGRVPLNERSYLAILKTRLPETSTADLKTFLAQLHEMNDPAHAQLIAMLNTELDNRKPKLNKRNAKQ